ncbi:hypothetical protein BpHYR1_035558 [Brachionus plicatilis]|uniref:Uncharacterized protein n=1 Tax=Brachionus plicatilis TaxID=10195 RepID=A0A3M7PNG7_BRAPC|nr:hypothetical protein BpHYR1_035558 [Brachionus plicatilis]
MIVFGQTYLNWCNITNLCSIDIDKANLKLGGRNKIVEIDESLYAKVKHNKGKDLKRPQVFIRVGTWQSKRAKQIAEKAKKTRKNKSIENDQKSKKNENIKGLLQPELAPVIDLQSLTSNGQTAQDENIEVKHRAPQKTKQSDEEKEDPTFTNKKKIDDIFAPDRPVRNRKKPDWFGRKET